MSIPPRFFIFILFVFPCTLLFTTTPFCVVNSTKPNNRPIVGILTQKLSSYFKRDYSGYKSIIVASYVKFIEGSGGRVVPIWIDQDECYYEDILSKINGVVFPGGINLFNETRGYADAGNIIYRIAKRKNDIGDYFPILGICLGFELLAYVASNRLDPRIECSCTDKALPLMFAEDFRTSRMFTNAPSEVVNTLTIENVTPNFHHNCVTKRSLRRAGINDFRVISTNIDDNGIEFVSSMEHRQYPFYGLQFHPEKNLYEWKIGKNIPHRNSAVEVAQYFANFFLREVRKNHHTFPSEDEEIRALINNYPVQFTALTGSALYQCYMFE